MISDVIINEILQSWKTLIRKPAFLVLAGLTLALGVAGCITVFALARASLMAPIAVSDIERVSIMGPMEGEGQIGGMSPIQFNNLGELPGAELVGIAAPAESSVTVLTEGQALMLKSWQVSGNFLSALDVNFSIGRGFNSDESLPNGPDAVIISHDLWQSSFAGSADVLNRSIQIGERPVPIIGVLPSNFPYQNPQILLPLTLSPNDTSWSGSYQVVVRLEDGTTRESIANIVTERLNALEREYNRDRVERIKPYVLHPIEDFFRARTSSKNIMLLFASCAAVLLLVVLVNLSNLSLLRIVDRTHDSAVRRALGAPMHRILLPIAGEQILIALIACSGGVFIAWFTLKITDNVIPAHWFVSAETRPTIDIISFSFAFFVALFSTSIALLVSAIRARFASMKDSLVGGGRSGGDRGAGLVGQLLVSMQAAMATILLLMAVLSIKTLWSVSQVEYGFKAEQALVFHITPDRKRYPDQQAVLLMADAMVSNLEGLSGVVRAGYGTNIPASGTNHNDTAPYLMRDGRVLESITSYLISPGYLDAMSIVVIRGEKFDALHSANSDSIIITEELENAVGEGSLIGRDLALPYHSVNPEWDDLPLRIRGVSGGVRAYGPQRESPPIVWVPFIENTTKLYDLWRDSDSLYFVVKVSGNPAAYVNQIKSIVHMVAPTLAIGGLKPLSDYQDAYLSAQRLNLSLILIFAFLSLGLTSIGTYSVMAVNVANKKYEFGIRAALGAQPGILLRSVFITAGKPLIMGLVVGLIISFFVSRLIESVLFGVSAADPFSIVIIISILLLSGVLACIAPAIKASRTNPISALRID